MKKQNGNNAQRIKQLRKIDTVITIYANILYPSLLYNPKGLLALLIISAIGYLFSLAVYGILLGVIVYLTIVAITPKQTFSSRIYQILFDYEPVLQSEYDILLKKIQNDTVTIHDLLNWMADEYKQMKEVPKSESEAKSKLLTKLKDN